MQLRDRKTCPLCNSKQINLYKKGTFDPGTVNTENFKITDSSYGSLWTFFICKDCNFVFSNPYIPEGNIVDFYSHLEDSEYSTEAEGRSKNFRTILKRLKRVRKWTENSGNRLLDIGSASGIFLHLARQEGYEIEGIEPSGFLVSEAKKCYGLKLFKGTLKDYNPGKKFSVITLLDIIEHLVDPATFLTKVVTMMEENGILVLVTPDINSLAAKLAGKRWWHYRVAHINFFNLNSINFLLQKNGYEIILKKKYVWNFSFFYLLTRIFPFLKKKQSLQKILKRLHLKLPLFDSWEIYARRTKNKI